MKRTTTLMNEVEALTQEACNLVDLRDDLTDEGREGSELCAATVRQLEVVRTERDALLLQLKTRDPGTRRNYVRAFLCS